MSRIRTIKPEFWTDSLMVQLPLLARLVYIGMWNFADDHGRLADEPDRLGMEVMPREDPMEVETCIDLLIAAGRVSRMFARSGESYLQIEKWADHQKVDHPSRSRFGDAYKKSAVRAEDRRKVAETYGCPPGETADARCYCCGAIGSIYWHKLSNGRPSFWVSFSGLEIDHFVPEYEGGATSADNFILTCRACNRSRGTTPMIDHLSVSREPSIYLASPRDPSPLKGREGKGEEKEKNPSNESLSVAAREEARERFWSAYPNKVGRPSADRALDDVLSLGVAVETVLDGVRRYAASKPPDRQWLSPANFLIDARYLDEPAEVKAPQKGFSPSEAAASIPSGKVLVKPHTPQGDAWDADFRRRTGKGMPVSDKTGGWYQPSEYPPGYAPPSPTHEQPRAAQ